MKVKKITTISLFVTISLILSILENSLPPIFVFAPSIKLGIANIVCLVAFIILGIKESYIILSIRCIFMSIFIGNVQSLIYSLPAGLIALTVQIILYKFVFPYLSLMTISLIGAIIHNFTQLLISSLVVQVNLFAILPLFLLASTIAGIIIGLISHYVIKYLPKTLYYEEKNEI